MAKIRMGFVSNSSSSSFIVSGKKGKDKAMVAIIIDMKELSNGIVETLDELNAAIVWEYGYGEADNVETILAKDWFDRKVYEELVREIENGNVVYFGSVSTEDDGIAQMYVANNGFGDLGPDFKVIQDAGEF